MAFPPAKVKGDGTIGSVMKPRRGDLLANNLLDYYSVPARQADLIAVIDKHIHSSDGRVAIQALELLCNRLWGRPVQRELVAGRVDHTVKGLTIKFVSPMTREITATATVMSDTDSVAEVADAEIADVNAEDVVASAGSAGDTTSQNTSQPTLTEGI
jgi:hypothetical protein